MGLKLTILFCIFFSTISSVQAQGEPKLVLPIGHTDYISSVYFSPDGKYILTKSEGQIMLWETKSGRMLQSIRGESTNGFTEDGSAIITYHQNIDALSYIQFSDLLSAKILNTIEGSFIRFNKVMSHALISSDDGYVSYWDIVNQKMIFKTKAVLGVFILNDEFILVANNIDKDSDIYSFKIIEINTQKIIRSYQGILSGFSENFICLEEDSVLQVYDLNTGDSLQTIQLPKNNYYADLYLHFTTKFTVDEKHMIAYETDHSDFAVLFNTDFKSSKTFDFKNTVQDIVFNPDGKSFIAMSHFMDSIATAIDMNCGDTLFYLKGHKKYIRDLQFSPDRKNILTASADATAILWDAHSGKKIRTFEGKNSYPAGSVISPDQKYLAYFIKNQLLVFELSCFHKILSAPMPYSDIVFSSDSRHIILCNPSFSSDGHPIFRKINVLTGTTTCSFDFDEDNTSNYSFNKDGTLIAVNPNNKEDACIIYNDKKENIFSIQLIEGSSIDRLLFSSDHRFCIILFSTNSGMQNSISTMVCFSTKDWKIIWEYNAHFVYDNFEINEIQREIVFKTGISDSSVSLLNLEDGSLISNNHAKPLTAENYIYSKEIFFSPNGSVFSVLEHYNIRFYQAKTGKMIFKIENEDHITSVHFFDEKKVILEYLNNPMEFWDLESKTKTTIKNMDGYIVGFYGSNFIITDGYSLTMYDKDFNKKVALMNFGTEDYINVIDNGYYNCTQNASKQLYYVTKDLKTIGFEQLDIKYNRPDKVLEAIGNTDTTLINSYRRAYEKRIKKLGIDTSQFEVGYSVPESDFENRASVAYEQQTDKLTLKINGRDDTYKLDRFNVWVNEVPVFGERGINIRASNRNQLDTTITITLSNGENKIETSVLNVNGIESYRIPMNVRFTPNKKKQEKVYFVGIGINDYQQSGHDLQWSVKDIRDLAKKLKEQYGDDIQIDTLFDAAVSRESVLALKRKLLQSEVNDKVIISFSGHGLLSSTYDYYLSTYAIDFSHPEVGGLHYEDLEWLLDSIPARQKLMLIDACHSGEVDKEELQAIANLNEKQGIKGATIAYEYKPTLGMQNSFELMQELFTNVNKGTGATVIAASGGTQFAQERGDLQNGVFTFSILELMQQKQEMKLSELKTAVGKRVEELTDGLQKPTSRNETIENDWWVW
jgi:WD40 repeat protein